MNRARFLWVPVWVWDRLASIAPLISLLAIIVAGFLALLEYNERQHAARAAETLRLIEVWETRGAFRAYSGLSTEIRTMLFAIPEAERNEADSTTIRTNISRRALRTEDPLSFDLIVYFFTRLSLCVQAELCSAEVAAAFFEDTLDDFLLWFETETKIRRRLDRQFAVELEELATIFDDVLSR